MFHMARPQLTSDQIEATRNRLAAVALDLYLREGPEALSFRRLADAAGVSHTLPYSYFSGKEALIVAVRVACTQRFERFVRAREKDGASAIGQIRNIALAYVAFVEQHRDEYELIFTMQQPAPDAYPELLAARRSFFDHAVGLLQQAIDQGQLRGKALELAHLFWISLHGLMTLHVAGQLVHGMTLGELVEPLVERMLAAGGHVATSASPRKSTRPARRRSP